MFVLYRFGQATLMHVLVACAPLPASTGVVHGPRGAGHPVAVVAGVGRVVGAVGMVVVMVVAAGERGRSKAILNVSILLSSVCVQNIIKQILQLSVLTQYCKSCGCAKK